MIEILFDNFIRDHCEISTNWIELNILHVAFSDYCAKNKSVEWTNEHVALNKLTTLTLAIEAGERINTRLHCYCRNRSCVLSDLA